MVGNFSADGLRLRWQMRFDETTIGTPTDQGGAEGDAQRDGNFCRVHFNALGGRA